MSHEHFLRNLLYGIAAALGTIDFIIMSDFSKPTLVATSLLVLLICFATIYYFAAGGYHITKAQIDDAVKGMRG